MNASTIVNLALYLLFFDKLTWEISDDDLLDIGTGEQKLEGFIPRIICHSTKNEFAVGKKNMP